MEGCNIIKLLIGGSPCTKWSIAQNKNRETKPEGEGWELFKNFLIAKEKYKPDYFLYENNKSAAQPIKDQISKELGVPLQYINSALVSAQNRQRFYAHNIPNVPQPEDKGVLLRDIIESGINWIEKSYALTTRCMGAIPEDTIKRHRHTMIAEPVCVAQRGRYTGENRSIEQHYEAREDGKTNVLTTVSKDNLIAEPIAYTNKQECLRATYYKSGKRNFEENIIRGLGYQGVPVRIGQLNKGGQGDRIYSINGKSICLSANGGGRGAKTGLYAIPVDGAFKSQPVYIVTNGLITINDKCYPIKLPNGYYIIRKLTILECKRLQTVPDEYIMPCSATQNYKMLGNGWTVDVIAHILSYIPNIKNEIIEVLSMYDGMSCGHIALDKLNVSIVNYYSTEIDKYAIQTVLANYPNTTQLGDAFQVRDKDWIVKVSSAS